MHVFTTFVKLHPFYCIFSLHSSEHFCNFEYLPNHFLVIISNTKMMLVKNHQLWYPKIVTYVLHIYVMLLKSAYYKIYESYRISAYCKSSILLLCLYWTNFKIFLPPISKVIRLRSFNFGITKWPCYKDSKLQSEDVTIFSRQYHEYRESSLYYKDSYVFRYLKNSWLKDLKNDRIPDLKK